MSIFEKWKAGQSVTVRTLPLGDMSGGNIFTIQPEQFGGVTIGYTILQSGKPVKSQTRKMMADADFRDWTQTLEIVE